jgi:hypothetical protein
MACEYANSMTVKIIDKNSANNDGDSIFGVDTTFVSKQSAAVFAGWCDIGTISYSIAPRSIHRSI